MPIVDFDRLILLVIIIPLSKNNNNNINHTEKEKKTESGGFKTTLIWAFGERSRDGPHKHILSFLRCVAPESGFLFFLWMTLGAYVRRFHLIQLNKAIEAYLSICHEIRAAGSTWPCPRPLPSKSNLAARRSAAAPRQRGVLN